MNARIASAVSSGEISTTDQSALTKALDSIDKSLKGSSKSGGDIKSKIDALIDSQVSAGTLTDAQANELQNFFAQGAPAGSPPSGDSNATDQIGAAGAVSGPRGPGGPGGPPPPPPASDDDDDSSSSSATTISKTADEQLKTLEALLDKLRESLSSTATYGTASTATAKSGLVFQQLA